MSACLFSSRGRMSRRDFWTLWIAPAAVGLAIANLADQIAFTGLLAEFGPFTLSYLAMCGAACWPISVRRLHDLGLSERWLVYGLCAQAAPLALAAPWTFCFAAGVQAPVALANLAWLGGALFFLATLIVGGNLMIAPGQKGDNVYGADPLQARQRMQAGRRAASAAARDNAEMLLPAAAPTLTPMRRSFGYRPGRPATRTLSSAR